MHLLFYRFARAANVVPSHPCTCHGTAPCTWLSICFTFFTISSKTLAARLTTELCASVRVTSHFLATFTAYHLPAFPSTSQHAPRRLFITRNANLLRASSTRHELLGASSSHGEHCGHRHDAVVPGHVCALRTEMSFTAMAYDVAKNTSSLSSIYMARAMHFTRRAKGE